MSLPKLLLLKQAQQSSLLEFAQLAVSLADSIKMTI